MIAQSLPEFARDALPRILPAYRKPFLRSDEPRYIHGCAHVCRSIIFSEALLWTWRETFGFDAGDRFAIRHAIAWHDAGREGDGADFWEEDSAALASSFLVEAYALPQAYAAYVGRLIVKPGDATDANAVTVTAVDSLDILRLISLRDFDMDRFPWLHPEHDPVRAGRNADGLAQARQYLVEDAAGWIDETTEWRMQKALEADDLCFETLAAHLLSRETTYPRLARPLREALNR